MDGQPVRQVLPRALFLFLADHGRADRRRAWPDAVRCRGAADPRRVAAGLSRAAPTRTRRPEAARQEAAARTRAGGGLCRPADLRGPSASRSPRPSGGCSQFLIEAKSRQAVVRLRRAGQGQHAAELLRDPHRLPGLHGRPQSLQARPLHPRHAHPDPSGGGIDETKPDYLLILPWNLTREITRQMRYVGDWGCKLRGPDTRSPGDRPCGDPGMKVVSCSAAGWARASGTTRRMYPSPMVPVGQRSDPLAVMQMLQSLRPAGFRLVPGLQGQRRSSSGFSITGRRSTRISASPSTAPRSGCWARRRRTGARTDRHRHLAQHRRAAAGGARAGGERGDVPRQLQRWAERRIAAGHDRVLQEERQDRLLHGDPAQLQLSSGRFCRGRSGGTPSRTSRNSETWINGGYFIFPRRSLSSCGRARSWWWSRSSG